MAKFKGVVRTTEAIYEELVEEGYVIIDGVRYDYDPDILYVTDYSEQYISYARRQSISAAQKAIARQNLGLSEIGDAIPYTEKGQPNGVATLGGDGKIPSSQIPEYVLGTSINGGVVTAATIDDVMGVWTLDIAPATTASVDFSSIELRIFGDDTIYTEFKVDATTNSIVLINSEDELTIYQNGVWVDEDYKVLIFTDVSSLTPQQEFALLDYLAQNGYHINNEVVLTITLSELAQQRLETTDTTRVITYLDYNTYPNMYFINGVEDEFEFAGKTYLSGDWLVSTASAWTKIDNNDKVSSVNGLTGAVVLPCLETPENAPAKQSVVTITEANVQQNLPMGDTLEVGLNSSGNDILQVKSTALAAESFTYVIDSNLALENLCLNRPGYDFSRVLVRTGEWSYGVTFAQGAIVNLTQTNTKVVVGEPGAKLKDMWVDYNALPTDNDYRIENIECAGFTNCRNLKNCKILETGKLPLAGHSEEAFYNCVNLENCFVNSGFLHGGFNYCKNLKRCVAYGYAPYSNCKNVEECEGSCTITGPSTARAAFRYCYGVRYCKKYDSQEPIGDIFDSNCYASQSANSAYLVADTADGGFNATE